MRRTSLAVAKLMLLAVLLNSFSGQTLASTPADLIATLKQLNTNTPVTTRLISELWSARGKGDDREETTNTIEVSVADNPQGISVRYAPELLQRLDDESARLTRDPDAKTPLHDFIWRLDLNQIRPLLSPAQSLQRTIERAEFREATPDEYADREATRLIFDRDKSVVHERMRRYVKEFHSTLEVWVDENGRPLASRLKLDAEGSILFVIRGEHQEEIVSHYDVEGGRLLTMQREEWQKTDMPGEHHESRLKQSLSLTEALKQESLKQQDAQARSTP